MPSLPTSCSPATSFRLRAQNGGVLVRAGHTEAGCDLAQLAGLTPASVICEILKDDGEMARLPDLIPFAKQHGLKIGTIADLIEYRSHNETLVERVAQRTVQTAYGELDLVTYTDKSYASHPPGAGERRHPAADRDAGARA